jgi:hypothetical protein
VQQRIPTPHKLHYKNSFAAVVTADEQQLFQQLHKQHTSSSGTMRDWTAFARDWNSDMYQIRVQPEGSRLQLTFKQVSHLKAYDRKLAKSAQQQHTAALGQLAFQLPASPAAPAAGQSS